MEVRLHQKSRNNTTTIRNNNNKTAWSIVEEDLLWNDLATILWVLRRYVYTLRAGNLSCCSCCCLWLHVYLKSFLTFARCCINHKFIYVLVRQLRTTRTRYTWQGDSLIFVDRRRKIGIKENANRARISVRSCVSAVYGIFTPTVTGE